jgi:hypothetical protein
MFPTRPIAATRRAPSPILGFGHALIDISHSLNSTPLGDELFQKSRLRAGIQPGGFQCTSAAVRLPLGRAASQSVFEMMDAIL